MADHVGAFREEKRPSVSVYPHSLHWLGPHWLADAPELAEIVWEACTKLLALTRSVHATADVTLKERKNQKNFMTLPANGSMQSASTATDRVIRPEVTQT